MKYFLTTILLLLFAQFNLYAQRNTVFQPIQEDMGYTPYQRNVPFEFQFFINDDLTRVLFNSSNLAQIDSNQVYVTIEPGSSRNYRFAYLSSNNWALNGSFRNIYDDSFSTAESFTQIVQPNTDGIFSEEQIIDREIFSQRENERETNVGELRFSKLIKRKGGHSRSIGIFVGYDRSIFKRVDNSSSLVVSTYREFRNDTLIRVLDNLDEDQNFSVNENNAQKLRFGVEYAYSSTNTNGFQRLFGQLNDQESTFNGIDINISERIDERPEDSLMASRFDQINRMSGQNYHYSPWLIGYKGYLNHKVDWIGDDFIFASVEALYGSDKVDFRFSRFDERIRIQDGTSQTFTNFDIAVDEEDKNEYQFSADVQFGYGISVKMDEISIFTGITQSLQYIQHEGYLGASSIGILKFNDNYHKAVSTIPVFAEYSLNRWVSVFGGANMRFIYSMEQIRGKLAVLVDDNDILNYPDKWTQRFTSNEFIDNTSTYFGLKASHKSGFRLMADINGDLARLSGWYFTLGYQF